MNAKHIYSDHAHICTACIHKIDTDHFSLLDFPFIAFFSVHRFSVCGCIAKIFKVSLENCVYVCVCLYSHNLIQYIYEYDADLFNRCSLFPNCNSIVNCSNSHTTYGPYMYSVYCIK